MEGCGFGVDEKCDMKLLQKIIFKKRIRTINVYLFIVIDH